MKQLVHDNINQFVGICFDKRTEFYAIWNHCFRGTLADMMFLNVTTGSRNKLNSDDKNGPAFQENFKRAFIRDIIRVCFCYNLLILMDSLVASHNVRRFLHNL